MMAFVLGTTGYLPLKFLLPAAGVVTLYLFYKWLLPKPIPGIPYNGAATKNLLGDVPELMAFFSREGRTRPWFRQQFPRHKSPIVQYFILPFSKPIVGIADFRESQDILLRRYNEFDHAGRTLDVFRHVIPNHHISMTSTDPRFKRNKDLVRDLMSPKFLHQVSAPQIYAKTMLLVELWNLKADAAGEGKPFEARADVLDTTMDMITAAAFGFDDSKSMLRAQLDYLTNLKAIRPSPLKNGSVEFSRARDSLPETAAINILIAHVGLLAKSVMPGLFHKWKWLTQPSLRTAYQMKKVIAKREIDNAIVRLNRRDEKLSAMDDLLQREKRAAEKEGRAPDFHSDRIVDELYGYLVAGHESTSASLSWTLKLLADHQEIQTKLRCTLHNAFKEAHNSSRQPTSAEITASDIPYLDAVFEEGLRVYPPFPMNIRQAVVDTTILGRPIPKGTNVYLMANSADYLRPPFPVPDELRTESSRTKSWGKSWDPEDMHLYKPERWLKKSQGNSDLEFDPMAGPFISFSLGKRGCFGRRLAHLQSRLLMVLLVWNFEICKLSEELSSYDAREDLFTYPLHCYVGLKKLI